MLEITNGTLTHATFLASPNCDERPDSNDITGIVIHNISLPPGEFGGGWITDLFLNKLDPTTHPYFQEISGLKVSSHLLIRRNGELVQYVPFQKRAWHAGVSSWDGREKCNDFTIGIELEGCDDQSFESVQYQQLADVIKSLVATYPKLTTDTIKGHQHIAPGRKTDPGPFFEWRTLSDLLTSN